MHINQRLSIMAFPQQFDGTNLNINIVVMPRDHNPLNPIIVDEEPAIPNSDTAFADATFNFNVQILKGFGTNPLPQPQPFANGNAVETNAPDKTRSVFEAVAEQLDIINFNMVNNAASLQAIPADRKFEAPRPLSASVKKYLPKSLTQMPGFTGPKSKNAVTDDSYHCALKDAKYHPNFEKSPNNVSWGKVFAYILRQPLLARNAGFIYSTQITIEEDTFPDGGYLYFELSESASFFDQQNASSDFIKRYACRIPPLEPGVARPVFAPILFPVMASHDGNYDKIFIETSENDDGFAKLVHCRQPPNRDLIEEEPDDSFPVKDVGIQLCWNDELILKWYTRQLAVDPSVSGTNNRIDAPLGVFGYNIDVREASSNEEDDNDWNSLNLVTSKQPMILTTSANEILELGNFEGELPYQVYPMQLDGTEQATGQQLPYWLPMYFASWNGHSMVLPDPDAARVYQTTNEGVESDPYKSPATDTDGNATTTGTGVDGPAKNNLNDIYDAGQINTNLRYGNTYQFRIRMQDLSGGSPNISVQPVNETPTDIATCQFKRFIAPNQPRIVELEANPNAADGEKHQVVSSDIPSQLNELNIRRPKLGYPAVVYTGKYTNPIERLKNQSDLSLAIDSNDRSVNAEHRVGLGIADPDVECIEIAVEIESLKLDKLDSISGKEDYVHLYTTKRFFPSIDENDDNFEANLNIPIIYRDVEGPDKVLNTGTEISLVQDLGLEDDIDNLDSIVLPTARVARLTIRAVCEDKSNENDTANYYGVINNTDHKKDVRYGEPFAITLYQPSTNETDLLVQSAGVPELQGIFMQPDVNTVFDGKISTFFFGKTAIENNSNVQQLADQLNIEASGLTLNAKKGNRIVFGCSSRIRHTLAPDVSSLTFSSKTDLFGHWLCCISYEIDRDWMWDALKTEGFILKRTLKYKHSEELLNDNVEIDRIKIIRTASFEALDNPKRNSTRLVYIDAVEPKKTITNGEAVFPDSIEVTYTLEPQFKDGHGVEHDELTANSLTLPITTPPAQIPKIVSAGIALTPYERDDKYSTTKKRQRALWIELEEEILDPQDTIFCRMLANSPDQLISNNNPVLFVAPEEPPLPISKEEIRIITSASSNDLAGLNAMQPMIKSSTSSRHFILPVPPGLHANSDEMFGFFSYEFRVGHYERQPENEGENPEKAYTTAQGRFGRRLKMDGIQHPAPILNILPNRNKDSLWVTAPYAVAVHNGKNVTADPPRTELWAMLYAQVHQADKKDFRNILLDDRPLSWRVRVEKERDKSAFLSNNKRELDILNKIIIKTAKGGSSITETNNNLKLVSNENKNLNSTKFGTTVWDNKTVNQLLLQNGLPLDSNLSVIVVEVLPQITSIFEHISGLEQPTNASNTAKLLNGEPLKQFANEYVKRYGRGQQPEPSDLENRPSPVSDRLGHHRILRVSNLVKVPDICCADC